MSKEEFIDWIESLGFKQTWQSNSDEYSIFIKLDKNNPIVSPKLYFNFYDNEIGIYYSNFSNNMLSNGSNNIMFGSNLGRFPLSSIGEFEKLLIVTKLSEYFDELPSQFKSFLRDSKIKNILRD